MQTDNGKKKPEENLTWQQNIMLYLHDLCYMLAILMLLLTICFRIIVVNGPSMKMTLLDGDYLLLVNSVFYHNPERGDVVVVSKPTFEHGKPIVKRVIATEGQIVDIDFESGYVFVDGIPQEEPYTNTMTNVDEGMTFPLIVQENCVFVMGDNRNNSKDSRHPSIGQVDTREILGKVVLLMVPGTDYGTQPRNFGRIGAIR